MKKNIAIALCGLFVLCSCQKSDTNKADNCVPPYPAIYSFTDTLLLHSDTILAVDSFLVQNESVYQELNTICHWYPRAIVSDSTIALVGLDKCFAICPITDQIFERINGHSFRSNSPVKRTELRYLRLLHRNFAGENQLGEMIVHQSVAQSVIRIFRELYQANYPIDLMVLIDDFEADDNLSMAANNTSCFNVRTVPGMPSTTSHHAYGMAIDVNPLYNPYIQGNKVYPEEGKAYVQRDQDNPYFITSTSLITKLFREEGFVWGGNWTRSKDYQHFQKR